MEIDMQKVHKQWEKIKKVYGKNYVEADTICTYNSMASFYAALYRYQGFTETEAQKLVFQKPLLRNIHGTEHMNAENIRKFAHYKVKDAYELDSALFPNRINHDGAVALSLKYSMAVHAACIKNLTDRMNKDLK